MTPLQLRVDRRICRARLDVPPDVAEDIRQLARIRAWMRLHQLESQGRVVTPALAARITTEAIKAAQVQTCKANRPWQEGTTSLEELSDILPAPKPLAEVRDQVIDSLLAMGREDMAAYVNLRCADHPPLPREAYRILGLGRGQGAAMLTQLQDQLAEWGFPVRRD